MKKQIVDLSVFWESAAKHNVEEREEERRHIEAVLNQALAGVSAVSWSGMAVRGIHHIRVGCTLGLSFLDAGGNVLANVSLLMSSRLILRTWPDDGGLLEIAAEDDG